MAFRIQLRRDLAARWSTNNPILLLGEFGYEMDTGYAKIGDGETNWNDLDYFVGEVIAPSSGAAIYEPDLSGFSPGDDLTITYSQLTTAGIDPSKIFDLMLIQVSTGDEPQVNIDFSPDGTTNIQKRLNGRGDSDTFPVMLDSDTDITITVLDTDTLLFAVQCRQIL